MKRITLALAVVLVPLAFVAVARADTTVPFPSNQVNGVFVAAQTVTKAGAVGDQFKPGQTVVFRAFAVDTKAHKFLTKKFGKLTKHNAKLAKRSLRSFFVRIPLVDDQQLAYKKVPKGLDPRYRWVTHWKVPALYPVGVVQFEVFAKMWNKQSGTFTQVPISLSQLTITTTPQEPLGPGPTTQGSVTSSNVDVVLYGDAVAGHSRPVACSHGSSAIGRSGITSPCRSGTASGWRSPWRRRSRWCTRFVATRRRCSASRRCFPSRTTS